MLYKGQSNSLKYFSVQKTLSLSLFPLFFSKHTLDEEFKNFEATILSYPKNENHVNRNRVN